MDIMARGRQMLSPGIIITVTDTLMVDMAITVIMARGRLMLSPVTIIMDMAMDMDMDTMATMARERLSQDISSWLWLWWIWPSRLWIPRLISTFIYFFSKFSHIHWNLLESSQQKHPPQKYTKITL